MYLFLILAILAIVFYYMMVKNNDYWKKRKVPYEKPTFFFGSFKDTMMGSKHFGIMYYDLYQKSKNYPYYGYFKLREPSLIINDPELIKNVLIKDYAYFQDNDFHVDPEVDRVFAANVFGQTGEKWKKTRSAWTYGMTSSKIKAMYGLINEKCDIMVEDIRKHIRDTPNQSVEARLTASRFFTDAIVDCMLGIKVNSFEDKNNPYTKVANNMFKSEDPIQGLNMLLFIVAPRLASILNIGLLPKESEEELIKLARKVLESRKTTGYKQNNPFDAIIMHRENNDSITELEVAGFLFGFLLDGTETSAGVSGYAMYELSKNLDIQQRLRDELEKVAEANGGNLTYEDIHQNPYLDMVVSETMRKYPPSLAIQRMCTREYEFPPIKPGDKPVKIYPGTPITVATYALHMDPKYFPNPEKFDPERFSSENRDNIVKMTYMPFGEGPRICLGSRLAMNQVKIGLAAMVRNFEIRPAPEMTEEKMALDTSIFVMRPKGGLWVRLHNRV